MITALTTGLDTPVQEMYAMAASVPARTAGSSELTLSEAYLKFEPFSDAGDRHDPRAAPRARARRPAARRC